MAYFTLKMFAFILILCYSQLVYGQLDDFTSCSGFCTGEYELSEFQGESCARGCRFYTISSFLIPSSYDGDKYDAALDSCFRSCKEAYKLEGDENASCEEGCKKQHQTTTPQAVVPEEPQEPRKEGEDGEEELPSGVHLATPVLQVRKVVAQVIGSFHILKTSVLTYFLQDDNTLLAVQSQPKIIVDLAPEEGFESPQEALQPAESSQMEGKSDFNFDSDRLKGVALDEVAVARVPIGSRRYAYLLHLLVLLAVVSLALLGLSYCLGVVRQQQRKTLKAANLNVALQQEPLKLVRPEDLTKLSLMEEEEAPRLPNKQDLALTHAKI